ncbi:MAG: DUF429 domain-containing protein [Planctomycetota bacterium]|nr:DUF429 domain-containing protein [Planctomycetota bacterium]
MNQTDRTTIIGIDCATNEARVGLSFGVAGPDRCVATFAGTNQRQRGVAEAVAEAVANSLKSKQARALIALDAPLGWPHLMGESLATHRAGEHLAKTANELFRRETDRFVKTQLGKQSLDVGADRIARTAHSALQLLADVRQRTGLPIPMAWESNYSERVAVIEVYPAATLRSHGIKDTGYKRKDQVAERKAIIGRLERLIQLPEDRAAMERSADALDAGVCVLAAFDFLRGSAQPPEDTELSRHEGWIWVRTRPHTIVDKARQIGQAQAP